MKKIIPALLFFLLAVVDASAQIYRGEGGSFPIRYNTGSCDKFGYMRLHEPLATVCCYIDASGNIVKQTFGIYFYALGKEVDVKDCGKIAFCFSDGTKEVAKYETFLRKSDVWQTGINYAVGIEVETTFENLKNKQLCKTIVDGNNTQWDIETPAKRAKKINKAVVKSEQLAKSNALAAKARGEVYSKPFAWPTHVKKYLLEFYPEGTTFVGEKIDTIEVPARTLASLQFSMNLDMAKMSERLKVISEMQGETMKAAAKKEVATADSLFNEYDACLSRIDSIAARNKKCERNDYQNYQRVQVSYTLPDGSKGATDVMTRIGEENPSDLAMLFDLELSDCKAQLKKYKEYIEKIRLP